ncbi:MAG: hypothetical protein HXS52_03690 [Theionarchaea archaeon]|nr:hypothetical protein [Theionarchaea archaeon]MBU7037010.1 hypothetical protein [Theionarchaea archaeon]
MARSDKGSEKEEKDQEKSEKGEGKFQKDPLGGVFFGLILLTVGVVYILRSQLPHPELWWAWVLLGIGIVSLLDAGVRYSRPEWRRPVFGKVMLGVILITIGGSIVYDLEFSWALFLIAIGAVMLIYYLGKATRKTP